MRNKLIYAASIAAAVLGVWAAFSCRRPAPVFWEGKEVPENGLVLHPAGRDHPGNPDEAVRDFTKIYAAIAAYRSVNSKLPTLRELLDFSKPLTPGHQLQEDDFKTPDHVYADNYLEKDQSPSHYMLSLYGTRSDGSATSVVSSTSSRDVWLVCTDYTRTNQTVHRDRHSEYEYSGVFVVLWSDGAVEKIRNGDQLVMPTGKTRAMYFKGQSGIPPTAVTFREQASKDQLNKSVFKD